MLNWKALITDVDGDPDFAEIAAIGGACLGLGLAVRDCVVLGHPFDLQSYGMGLGALITALGLARKLSWSKRNTKQEGQT